MASTTGGNSSGSGSSISQVPSSVPVKEKGRKNKKKGGRNKRKYQGDPPLVDPNKLLSPSLTESPSSELPMEKSQTNPSHEQRGVCDPSALNQNQKDGLKPALTFSDVARPTNVGSVWPREKLESKEFLGAGWSEHAEDQLQELILSNLDTIFKCAIKKITACGYSEEVATKVVMRPGFCYGYKDTVSNIVDNSLAFLRSGQNVDSSREDLFEDLQQLKNYTLAEMVCVLKEVRPSLSIGDAMWCLLVCDLNLAHACAMDGDPLSSFGGDEAAGGSSSVSTVPQLKSEAKRSELNLLNINKTNPTLPYPHGSQSEIPVMTDIPNSPNPGNPLALEGLPPEKEGPISTSAVQKSSGVTDPVQTMSLPSIPEEKTGGGRKGYSNWTKSESIIRQKSLHLERNYQAHGSKGALRTGKPGGKQKPVSDSTVVNVKASSSKTSMAVGANSVLSTPSALNQKTINIIPPTLPIANTPSSLTTANTPSALPTANTELSLSLPSRSDTASNPLSCNTETVNCSYAGIPHDKTLGKSVPRDEQDEMILKLEARVWELQNQLQGWDGWANQKVMQATRRLGKDKAELKTLKQEKEEAARLKKEMQTLEENSRKKHSEMEYALSKASDQIEWTNSTGRRLNIENIGLRQKMEDAKLQAVEAAASCQEASKSEKKTLNKLQLLERQKTLLQEEIATEKQNRAQLEQEIEQANHLQDRLEAKWKQEEKAKEELLMQASSIRKEREQIETLGKAKEDKIRLNAENQMQRYNDDIQKLQNEISQLRLKTDSSKIAALRRDMDGSVSGLKGTQTSSTSKAMVDFQGTEDLKRERECVMCLTEERSVVFLPCAHQVVCTKCNELHEKQGMKDCPSCRTPIQRRICARFARS